MHFTNSSLGQFVCVKEEFPMPQDVWIELEYKLHTSRVTVSANTEHN